MTMLMEMHEIRQARLVRLGSPPPVLQGATMLRTMIARLHAALEEKAALVAVLETKVANLEDNQEKLTRSLAREMLRSRRVIPANINAVLSKEPVAIKDRWAVIVKQVAKKHGVTFIDIRSDRRDKKTYCARHECFYRIKHETTLSIPKIGHLLGNKDHTTVVHGIHRHAARIASGDAL